MEWVFWERGYTGFAPVQLNGWNYSTRARFSLVQGAIVRYLLRTSLVHMTSRDQRSFLVTRGTFSFSHLKPLCYSIGSCDTLDFHIIFWNLEHFPWCSDSHTSWKRLIIFVHFRTAERSAVSQDHPAHQHECLCLFLMANRVLLFQTVYFLVTACLFFRSSCDQENLINRTGQFTSSK